MPLSDYERRALEQIETALDAENPHLAHQLRTARPRRPRRLAQFDAGRGWRPLAQLLFATLLLILGFGAAFGLGTLLAVTGYLLIVTAVHSTLIARRRRRRH